MNLLHDFIKLQGILLTGLIMLVFGVPLQAAWLENEPVTFVQPNGDTLHLFVTGDEFYHYVHDSDGYTLLMHSRTDYWVYAQMVAGKLVASDYVYGTINPTEKGIKPRLTISNEEWLRRREQWGHSVPNRTSGTNHGTLNNIVVFVRFSDQEEFVQSYSSIESMFNNETEGSVSVVRYFDVASFGNIHIPSHFYPQPNGNEIISYQDPNPRNYYIPKSSTNPIGISSTEEQGERLLELFRDVIGFVKDSVPENMNIDFDNDNHVDNVVFVVEGSVDAYPTNNYPSILWPTRWHDFGELEDLMINGKFVCDVNIQLSESNKFTVGTLCHELNHTLGALDMYHDSGGDYAGLYPVWHWDLQSFDDAIPQQHTAYMKMKYDHWIEEIPDITETPGTYTLNALAGTTNENVAYKIRSLEDPNQFYVLEYRNKDLLFDSSIPKKGMIIYRIDTRYDGNFKYNPTKGKYDELYVFRLGGSPANYNGYERHVPFFGDPYYTNGPDSAYFSAQCGRVEFNVNTDPYPFLTNGTPDRSISIFDISEAGNTISFTYGYKIEASTNNEQGGTVSGSGLYAYNSICTLTATPYPGYIFKGWYTPAGLFPVNPLPTFTFSVSSNMHLVAKFQPATPTTDVYHYYCWFDQDYSTVQTGSFQTVETFFSLDASALNEGLHTLHVMLDDNGLSAPKSYLFLKTPVVSPTSTYTYHCWFDQDYGTVQTGTFGGEGFSFALDANELEEGIHTVHVMLEGDDLSASKTYLFLKAPVASPTATYTYHCWFDQDYETVQTGTFGGEGFSFALDANALEEGIHTVHVMLEGDDLSASKTYMFLKAPVASSTATYTYHCWFDQDYGTVQTGTFGGEGYCFAIDASALDNGLHFLNVMLEGDGLSASKRYLFNKVPIGGEGITRWEYCINGEWSDATVTDLVPTVSTLDIIAMLPVLPQPIRSQSFEFQVNNGQPEVYAKNFITFRFWDAENRFIDRSAEYVDETVHENVMAEWIERNTTRTIVTPGPNQIHWFKLDASVGDLMEFMADHECTIQLFSPSGELVFSSMSVASIVFNGSRARKEGIYYLAVHDVEAGYDNISITYRYTGATTQTQDVALVTGWNWISTYIDLNEVNGIAMLEEALGDNGVTIQTYNESADYFGDGEWSGLEDYEWTNAEMVMVEVSEDCTIALAGPTVVDPSTVEIEINPGWNWIGFPLSTETAIEVAMGGFEPEEEDAIQSNAEGTSDYLGEWIGDVLTLVPGQGYMYYSNSTEPRTLVFSTTAGGKGVFLWKHKE